MCQNILVINTQVTKMWMIHFRMISTGCQKNKIVYVHIYPGNVCFFSIYGLRDLETAFNRLPRLLYCKKIWQFCDFTWYQWKYVPCVFFVPSQSRNSRRERNRRTPSLSTETSSRRSGLVSELFLFLESAHRRWASSTNRLANTKASRREDKLYGRPRVPLILRHSVQIAQGLESRAWAACCKPRSDELLLSRASRSHASSRYAAARAILETAEQRKIISLTADRENNWIPLRSNT